MGSFLQFLVHLEAGIVCGCYCSVRFARDAVIVLLLTGTECAQCQQLPDRADLEPRILKLVCGKSHSVPELWAVREEDWKGL